MANKISKRMRVANEIFVPDSVNNLAEAVSIFLEKYKLSCSAKFNENIDAVFVLGIDTKKSDQVVRGTITMPSGIGKDLKILAIVSDEIKDDALKAGAVVAGGESLVESIVMGNTNPNDFDFCVAEKKMMPKIAAKVSKILGPKGLMPSEKLGTSGDNICQIISNIKKGMVEFKAEKGGIVHAPIGKLDFSAERVIENFKAIHSALVSAKPATSKGIYMKRAFLTTTQGPSAQIDLTSI